MAATRYTSPPTHRRPPTPDHTHTHTRAAQTIHITQRGPCATHTAQHATRATRTDTQTHNSNNHTTQHALHAAHHTPEACAQGVIFGGMMRLLARLVWIVKLFNDPVRRAAQTLFLNNQDARLDRLDR